MFPKSDDLNDSLDDLLGGKIVGERKQPPAHYTPPAPKGYFEPCGRCQGTGQTPWGVCFRCKGAKGKTFKTAPADRAKQRAQAAVKAEAKRIEKIEGDRAWRELHKAEIAWLDAAAERQHANAHLGRKVWNFPIELSEKLVQYGQLTEGQIGAIRKCIANDAQRAQAKVEAATDINVEKIEAAFARVRSDAFKAGAVDAKWRKLYLGTFTFCDMPARGQWKAAILVKDGERKIGRVEGGKFFPFAGCTAEQTKAVVEIAADPLQAAVAHGLKYSFCACCGAELTDPTSIARGIGPICAEKWFCA